MLVYYFVPFIVSNHYLLFWVSNGRNSVTVQNRTHVYMKFFHHKDLGNHLLQLCPKVVKHPVYALFLNLDTRQASVNLHVPSALTPVSIDQRPGWNPEPVMIAWSFVRYITTAEVRA